MPKGAKIKKKIAREWVNRYKAKHPEKDPKTVWSELFDKALVQEILNEPGCVGLRIYNSYNDDDQLRHILVGVNAAGEDLLPASDDSTTEAFSLAEDGMVCPGSPDALKIYDL